jgi:hypothetical protein
MYWSDAVAPAIACVIFPHNRELVVVAVLLTHPQFAVFALRSSVVLGMLQYKILRNMLLHTRVPRSCALHTHQFAGHAARAPSHVATRLLLLTFITGPAIVLVHSPAAFATVAPGLPSPHSFMAGPILPITVSTYVLFTASVPIIGVATLIILFPVMSSDFRMVVVPFISRSVAGEAVFMPILPVASVKRLRTDVPMVPDGGEASVQPARMPTQTNMIMENCFFMMLIRTAPDGGNVTGILF